MALDIAGAAAGAAPAPAAAPAAEAYGVTKRYGATTALLDTGIVVQPGETHALVGRNGAGKSTLVAVLTGLLKPDAGEVRFDGQPAPPLSDRDAWRQRAACVYQKSTIIPDLTVAENLCINRQARHGLIDWRGLRRRAADVLGEYGVDVDPRRLAGDLTVEQRQLVEIARALSFGARFIILDEPTAQLDAAAINRLFTRMQALRAAGVTFLFISHHLQEVYQVCQTVTVFRDARHILTRPVAQLSHDALVEAMTGEAVVRQLRHRPGEDVPGVAEHRDGLAHLVHLLQVMRDEQERDPGRAQRLHPGEEPVDRGGVELRGRLVQDDEARPERQRSRDLHELALLHREIAGQPARVDVDAVLAEHVRRPAAQAPPVDEAVPGLAVDEQVLGDGQVGNDGRLLVHAGGPLPPGVPVGQRRRRLAVEAHLAGIGLEQAGEHRHEG